MGCQSLVGCNCSSNRRSLPHKFILPLRKTLGRREPLCRIWIRHPDQRQIGEVASPLAPGLSLPACRRIFERQCPSFARDRDKSPAVTACRHGPMNLRQFIRMPAQPFLRCRPHRACFPSKPRPTAASQHPHLRQLVQILRQHNGPPTSAASAPASLIPATGPADRSTRIEIGPRNKRRNRRHRR